MLSEGFVVTDKDNTALGDDDTLGESECVADSDGFRLCEGPGLVDFITV